MERLKALEMSVLGRRRSMASHIDITNQWTHRKRRKDVGSPECTLHAQGLSGQEAISFPGPRAAHDVHGDIPRRRHRRNQPQQVSGSDVSDSQGGGDCPFPDSSS